MPEHTVAQGDTIETIAREHKVSRNELLGAPENTELLQSRTANQLLKGDVVFVPDVPPKEHSVAAAGSHDFVLRPRRLMVRVRFKRGGVPRKNTACTVAVDGGTAEEHDLDGTGALEWPVKPDAQELEIKFFVGKDYEETRTLQIGHLDPASEPSGAQQRLNNLGFDCGAEDGDIGEKSKSALSFFAASVCEEPSPDALDESMRLSLVEKHRS